MRLVEVYSLNDLKNKGYDGVLYHGTDSEFDTFDKSFSKTAKHIYTTPDPSTASGYGKHIYTVAAKLNKPANLIDDQNLINRIAYEIHEKFEDTFKYTKIDELFQTIKKRYGSEKFENHEEIYDIFIDKYLIANDDADVADAQEEYKDTSHYEKLIELLATNEAMEFLSSGKIYEYDYSGRLQDEILDLCFSLGYNHVIFYDYTLYGDPISYVFDDPNDLVIIGKYDE